jgi:hypothetical protein
VPPLEVWEKVFVDDADFMQDTHGEVGCVICHGGDSSKEDKDESHSGMIADPSEGNCDTCHSEIAQANNMSLHTTLAGYYTALLARGCDCEGDERLATAIDNHCSECHSSCGQCHVSMPDSVGGGLVSGHKIKAKPSTIQNCSACHGSRVDAEYFGRNEGIEGDLHQMAAGGMSCLLCHGEEVHGSGETPSNMYDNAAVVQCEDCHQDVYTDDNEQHQQHIGDLSCYVCHSVEYKNCYNCHVEVSDVGNCLFSTDPSQMNFKIGLNPIQSEERPYEYAVLRHVPVNPEIFSFYGEDLMPNFSAEPTWKYTSPHNIQLSTPQNADCNSCHGHPELFLTEDDVDPAELEANQDVIVPEIPAQIP